MGTEDVQRMDKQTEMETEEKEGDDGEGSGSEGDRTENGEKNSAAPIMELSDGFIEQVKAMAKELKNISGGIWALVEGIRYSATRT
jgi:hypothetical protein